MRPGIRSVRSCGWQWRPMKVAMVVIAGLLAAPLTGVAPAGAAVPKVAVLVRVQPGYESAVAAQVKALGGDPAGPMKILVGFMAKVPTDRVDALSTIPGVVSVVQGIDVGFDPALYNPEKISSSLYSVARAIGADDEWKHGD